MYRPIYISGTPFPRALLGSPGTTMDGEEGRHTAGTLREGAMVSKEHAMCHRAAIQDSAKHCHSQSPGEAESMVAEEHPWTSDPQREESHQDGREDIQC